MQKAYIFCSLLVGIDVQNECMRQQQFVTFFFGGRIYFVLRSCLMWSPKNSSHPLRQLFRVNSAQCKPLYINRTFNSQGIMRPWYKSWNKLTGQFISTSRYQSILIGSLLYERVHICQFIVTEMRPTSEWNNVDVNINCETVARVATVIKTLLNRSGSDVLGCSDWRLVRVQFPCILNTGGYSRNKVLTYLLILTIESLLDLIMNYI